MPSSIGRRVASALRGLGLRHLAGLGAVLVLTACIVQQPPGGGTPQPQPVQATYMTAAECTQRVGQNGGQGFWDIGLSTCYSCPAGYARTVFDVRGNTACQTGGPFGSTTFAENLGGNGCPQGTFQAGNGCYVCPAGTSFDPSAGAAMCR